MSEPTGKKFDGEKPRTDLLDPVFLIGIAEVLKFGAVKYDAHNWRGGIKISRLIGASLRHIFAFMVGEDRDKESGLSHIYHAGCCLMFIAWMMQYKPELDDRWKNSQTE